MRPRFVTLRLTDPRMGDVDGNSDLVRAVQSVWAGLEVDGKFGPEVSAKVADWQWRVGAPNHAGAITPGELQVLLGYVRRPREWVARAKERAGKANPTPVEVPVRAELTFVPRERWCPYTPRGFSVAPHAPGVPHVVHWFGPGRPADGDDAQTQQCVGFAHYHQFTLGWAFFAYNWAVLSSGLVLVGRGENVRSAATGSSVGNTYPSVLLMAGTEHAEASPEQLASLQALRERYGWGRRLKHSELHSTACPGPWISPWVNENR